MHYTQVASELEPCPDTEVRVGDTVRYAGFTWLVEALLADRPPALTRVQLLRSVDPSPCADTVFTRLSAEDMKEAVLIARHTDGRQPW